MTFANLLNRRLNAQPITDVPARWRVDTSPQHLQRQVASAPVTVQPAIGVSVRFEHGHGDYTIVLGSIIAGPTSDPVEVDYSFLDD